MNKKKASYTISDGLGPYLAVKVAQVMITTGYGMLNHAALTVTVLSCILLSYLLFYMLSQLSHNVKHGAR